MRWLFVPWIGLALCADSIRLIVADASDGEVAGAPLAP